MIAAFFNALWNFLQSVGEMTLGSGADMVSYLLGLVPFEVDFSLLHEGMEVANEFVDVPYCMSVIQWILVWKTRRAIWRAITSPFRMFFKFGGSSA